MTGKTATEFLEQQDMRRNRARELTHLIADEMAMAGEPLTPKGFAVLVDVFSRNGACIQTDASRAHEGLEPRDEMGWTPSDRLKAHQNKIEALMAIHEHFVSNKKARPE